MTSSSNRSQYPRVNLMYKLILLLLGLAPSAPGVAAAQTRPDDVRYGTPLWGVEPDPRLVRAAWAYDLDCTGLSPTPGYTIDEVVFTVVPAKTLNVNGVWAYGYWAHNRMIFLDERALANKWTLRHELMHLLLRGPTPFQGGWHPYWPFAYPCELMSTQHPGIGVE